MANLDPSASLFGPSPEQVQQQGLQNQNNFALQYAQMDPFTAAKYSIGSGVQSLGRGLFNLQDPNVIKAQQTQQAMSGVDTNDPSALLQAAVAMRAIDPQRANAMVQMARQQQAEASKQALEAAKTHHEMVTADELPKMRHEEALARLQQAADAAKQRSEDQRYSADQRREAAREATAARLEITQLVSSMKQQGVLTPAQSFKQQQAQVKDAQALRALNIELDNTLAAAKVLSNHPGLKGATGVQSMILSYPGSEASKAVALLEEFKAGTKMAGLNMVRQGGSIGAMTEREWPIVESMVANIDPKAGEKAVKAQMDKVGAKIEQIRNNAKTAYGEMWQGNEISTDTPTNSPTAPGSPPSKPFVARTPADVKALYAAGTISKERAKIILKDMGF